MRTAGMLLMDTPLPDGRIMLAPQDFIGGGAVSVLTPGFLELVIPSGTTTNIGADVSSLLLRYGMSDDAQQQYGKGTPSGGFQGAQAQPVTTLTPFTTPYGLSGRPPYASADVLRVPTSTNWRPKGLKPTAVTVAYSVTAGPMTGLVLSLNKTSLTVGAVPTPTGIVSANLPLTTAQTNLITTPIPVANQVWLNDFFDVLGVNLFVTSGGAALHIYGVYIDVAFNYN